MDQFTRRLIGFGVNAGDVDGIAPCRMCNKAISAMGILTHPSPDDDSLFEYHRWQPISESSMSRRSKLFPTYQYRIRSWNV